MTAAYDEYMRDLQGLSHMAANLIIDCSRDDGLTFFERARIKCELLRISDVITRSIQSLRQ